MPAKITPLSAHAGARAISCNSSRVLSVSKDPDSDDEEISGLTLIFTAGGQALLEEDGELVWASDDDDDFRQQFPDQFLNESDAPSVLSYLLSAEYLDAIEAPHVIIEIDSFDAEDLKRLRKETGSRN